MEIMGSCDGVRMALSGDNHQAEVARLQTTMVRFWERSLICAMIFSACVREALENQPQVELAPCSNWDLQAPMGATKGFSRTSLGDLLTGIYDVTAYHLSAINRS